MKKTHMLLLLASASAIGLAGCAGAPDGRQLSQKTVEYECGPGGEQPLSVQYTFQGDEVMSARVVHMNQAIDMARATSGHADMVGHTFRGGGYTWTAGPFDRDDVDEVDGDMLTQDAPAAAVHQNSQGTGYPAGAYGRSAGVVGNVLLRDCRVS